MAEQVFEFLCLRDGTTGCLADSGHLAAASTARWSLAERSLFQDAASA